MFLKSRKKRYLIVTQNKALLYEGFWDELPLAEKVIIEKSIEFLMTGNPVLFTARPYMYALWRSWSSFFPPRISTASFVPSPVSRQTVKSVYQKSKDKNSAKKNTLYASLTAGRILSDR